MIMAFRIPGFIHFHPFITFKIKNISGDVVFWEVDPLKAFALVHITTLSTFKSRVNL